MKFGRVGLCESAFGEAAEVVCAVAGSGWVACGWWMVAVDGPPISPIPVSCCVFGCKVYPLRRYRRSAREVDVASIALRVVASDSEWMMMQPTLLHVSAENRLARNGLWR